MKLPIAILFAAFCLTAVGQVPDYVPTEGLVAWWTFDGDTQDASDNQIHGTSIAASFVPDRFNNDAGAIHMEGNGLVDFGLDQRFGVVSGAGRTVAFWVKSEMQVIPRLQKYENSVSGNSNFFVGPAPYPPFSAANGITVTANGESAYTTIDLDWSFWFHVAVVYDGAMGESTLFIDGVPVATEPLTFNNNVSSQPLQLIAARVSNDYPDSNGEVDDLGFWQRVLSGDEILALYEASGPTLGCTNPSACNFNGEAGFDDGSCVECEVAMAFCGPGTIWDSDLQMCIGDGSGDINLDGCVQLNDLLDLLSAYGNCAAEESPWQCGDPLEYQGYDYATVQIGTQCWFAENARYMPEVAPAAQAKSTPEAPLAFVYGYQGTDTLSAQAEENYQIFGALYNFEAVSSWNLCPSGWHVPSDEDWFVLDEFIGLPFDDVVVLGWRGTQEGASLKSEYAWDGTDDWGFNALPGGRVNLRQWSSEASYFGDIGQLAHFWTSGSVVAPEIDGWGEIQAFNRYLNGDEDRYGRGDYALGFGMSVRCVKDSE